jgi:ATP-dependent DNA helicase RecQ
MLHTTRPIPEENSLEYFLNLIFRKNKFNEGQFETIARALIGKDSIVLLPTGAGKSIAFQLSALLLPGVSLVIAPILALIDDQIENLLRIGIDRVVGISSQISNAEKKAQVIKTFGMGQYLLCYVSPERLQTEEFRKSITALTASTPISLVAIDEAHCVSEWGHDFRTSYLNIGRTSRAVCSFKNKPPCLVALTGTASSSVLRDVQRELQITEYDAIITPKTFDRKELHFSVYNCKSSEKSVLLESVLRKSLPEKLGYTFSSLFSSNNENTSCGIVFCPHAKGKFGVLEVSNNIRKTLRVDTRYYSGKSPISREDSEWNNIKRKTASDFKDNKFNTLVATKSFGMGIDKPNIRYTIHYGIPSSIEAFYQEAGRAGRDRKDAECIVIVSNDNKERTLKLLDASLTAEDIENVMKTDRTFESDDDITRMMYFHHNSFKGIKCELNEISVVLVRLVDIEHRDKKYIISNNKDLNDVEKAIHRLVILGVVEDYTIKYSNKEFHVTLSGIDKRMIIDQYAMYVRGYNKSRVTKEVNKLENIIDQQYNSFVLEACKVLLEFIYDTIEKGRRRALNEMLVLSEDALKSSDIDEAVHNKIINYFESTYSEEIERILNDDDLGFAAIMELMDGYESTSGELLGGIRSPKDAEEIRAQVSRYLESTPDHPGLLMLRALSELFCMNYDIDAIFQNLLAAMKFATERYDVSDNELYVFLCWFLSKSYERNPLTYKRVASEIIHRVDNIEFAKLLISKCENDDEMLIEPSTYYFSKISEQAIAVLKNGVKLK